MDNIVPFTPRPELTARENLCEFIRVGREELSTFGASLRFDEPLWDVSEYIHRKGETSRTSLVFARLNGNRPKMRSPERLKAFLTEHPEHWLLPGVNDFAKAYVRYMHAFRPTQDQRRMNALKCLDAALSLASVGEASAEVTSLDASSFNEAAAVAKQHYGPSYAPMIGKELELLAEFLSFHKLVSYKISWRSPIPPQVEHLKRVGAEADAHRDAKLPSQDAIDAVAEVFQRPASPRDVMTSSSVGILFSAPMRIHELLVVPANCEILSSSRDGRPAYGLRWSAGKGADPLPKWITSEMVPVAQEALNRLRSITEPGRKLAKWYEENPHSMYLTPEFEHLRGAILHRTQIAEIMGIHHGSVYLFLKNHGAFPTDGYLPFAELERVVLSMLPTGFPWASKALHLKFSDMLFVVPLNLLHCQKGTCPVMFHAVTRQMVKNDLSGPGCIFERHGSVDSAGKLICMRSHQARHLLTTLALTGGMSQIDVAKWAGRKSVHQNRAYDHRDPEGMLHLFRSVVGNKLKILGPLSEVPKDLPITRREFALDKVPTAHTTDVGWCTHDYTQAPCELYDDCINCEEHLCVKGETQKNECARELLQIEESLLSKAQKARASEQFGADRWEVHHTLRIARLRGLVRILDDPSIPDGTVVQLCGTPALSASDVQIIAGD